MLHRRRRADTSTKRKNEWLAIDEKKKEAKGGHQKIFMKRE